MKKKLNFKLLITGLLITVFTITTSNTLIAQETKSPDLQDFKVIVEKTESELKMQCLHGCAWTELNFTINNDRAQAINEYGMTNLKEDSKNEDPTLADFLFTIAKTEDGVVLKGIEGSAWTDLSFTLSTNKSQAINQFGMTRME